MRSRFAWEEGDLVPVGALKDFDPAQPRAKAGTEKGGQWIRAGMEEASPNRRNLPAHIKALVLPPAWTRIQYNPDPDADLLAIGIDAKGRDQYVYSAKHAERQTVAKFARTREMAKQFAGMTRQAKSDWAKHPEAQVASLIFATGMRPGSREDTQAAKKAYGATTLLAKHVHLEDGGVVLKFTGKSGKDLTIPVQDARIASMLQRRAKAAKGGELFPEVTSASLRDYVRTLDGGSFTTKDIRTAVGTETAKRAMRDIATPTSAAAYKRATKAVGTAVSAVLGNTPTVALQSYIDPTIFARWRHAAKI